VFRFNPTINDGGISMARQAFEDLNLRRVMIMVQPDTDGYDEALSFSQTFTSLGGEIVHFIDTTAYLNFNVVSETLDTLVITREDQPDSLIAEAIYVPFTGPGANAIIDHVMTALEAKRIPVTVLGSEELGFLDHSADRLARFPIYHTSILDVTPKGDRLQVFLTSYTSRTFQNPNDFSYVGYDVATFLFETLSYVQHPDYVAGFAPKMPVFRGLSSQYHLNGSTSNHRVPVYHLTADGPKELISPPPQEP
jgi:ABC-type branched-subunit amino acid transport system substrate-binding protein